MKNIITAIAIFTTQAVLAIPSVVWVEIERRNDSVQYSIEGVRTKDFEQFAGELKKLAPLGKQHPSSELYFHVHIMGNLNISEILRIKEVLTPFGFDHYTIQSIPQYGTIVAITIGEPEDFQLFDRFKAKIIPLDE